MEIVEVGRYRIQKSCDNVDWQAVWQVIQQARLATCSMELTRKGLTRGT